MTAGRPTAAALRRALEAAFGLALEGLSDGQVLDAAGGALGGSHPALAPAGALARVVDRLPIDESWLFRDEGLWAWLEEEHLPALVERALGWGEPVRAVSLGCAGGQELHSLAILLQGLLGRAGVPASMAERCVRLRGLDASPARVAQAASGATSAWSVRRAPAARLGDRVRLADEATGRWQVDDSVRAMCRFEVANLLEVAAPGSGALRGEALVLCRHVLIYFRADEAAAVVAGLAGALDPGAVLVLSPSEAHLAASLAGLEPLPLVGAFRASPPRARPAVTAAARHGPSPARLRALPARAAARTVTAARPGGRGDTASRLAQSALAHAAAGRRDDALREARAACFHDPRGLLSRLVLGRELMAVDRGRGRAVLAELLEQAITLPAEADVPHAPGLSVGQLTTAARLLMLRGEGT
jgi:chemotaxis methyl-accepting protein methylase